METNCENCGATLTLERFEDQLSCQYCDTVHVPSLREDGLVERLDGIASDTACPLCTKNLSHAKIDEWRFLCCPGCRGLLIRRADLLKIILYCRARAKANERKPEPIDATLLTRSIDCPNCAEDMKPHPYYGPGDFVIDSCSQCEQVWLDGGELERSSTVMWGGSLWR